MRKFRLKTAKGKQVAHRLNEIVDKDINRKRSSRETLAKVLLSAEKIQLVAAEKSRQELFVKRSQETFQDDDDSDEEPLRPGSDTPPFTNEDWSDVNNDLFEYSGTSDLSTDSDETMRKPISPLHNSASPKDHFKASLKHSLKSCKKITKIVAPKSMTQMMNISKEIIKECDEENKTDIPEKSLKETSVKSNSEK